MRLLVWLLRAFVFFTLFAFALNNLHNVTVHWFFGIAWTAPMVIVVLAAFAAGCAIGLLSMLPGAWRRRQDRLPRAAEHRPASAAEPPRPAQPDLAVEHPPRDGI